MQVVIFNMYFLMTRCIKTFLLNRNKRKLLFGDVIYGILVIQKNEAQRVAKRWRCTTNKNSPGEPGTFRIQEPISKQPYKEENVAKRHVCELCSRPLTVRR